ncbi:MAG: hypothetical protein LBR52_05910 [Prevotellaceae bacterium]|jgi:hypothetical protein|nr:hypothetical protein [Prevotellaceae bacterium]
MKKTIIRLFILLFLAGFSFSCEKRIESSIPDYEVYIETNPKQYAELSIPCSAVEYVYTPGVPVPANFRFGYGGVLIYRNLEGKIRSCDLACPVEARPDIRVKVTMPYAECAVCGSRFDLSWELAVPVSGPAKESLRSYHASERANSIVVSN